MANRRPSALRTVSCLLEDVLAFVRLGLSSQTQLAAENLFLRKQLARWKSRPGRPPIPADLRRLIVAMARANPTWGEERIASELRLKLGLTVSPRTVGRYIRWFRPSSGGRSSQRWATFVRNHAHAVLACDFFITVTTRFRLAYVFVVLEVGTRRIVHWNVTDHPTSAWTIQQCRVVLTGETAHRFLIHDRDAIFAPSVDGAGEAMGIRVLKTPVRTPQANAFCERLIGSMRRECLDWLIPLNERHLRWILRAWVTPLCSTARPTPFRASRVISSAS
jgi:putative transposase